MMTRDEPAVISRQDVLPPTLAVAAPGTGCEPLTPQNLICMRMSVRFFYGAVIAKMSKLWHSL